MSTEKNDLFSFQGKVYTAIKKSDGTIDMDSKVWLGNVKEATLEMSIESEVMKESFSGNRADYGKLITGKTVTLNMTLTEWKPEPLALALYSQSITSNEKQVTGEDFPNVVDGDYIDLDGYFISDLVITDSAGEVLEVDVNYEVESLTAGRIKLLDVTGLQQPLSASYKQSESTSLAPFATVTPPERVVIVEGINTMIDKRLYVEMYRVQFEPVSSFSLINDTFGELPLTGTLLIDASKAKDKHGKETERLSGYMHMVTEA